ncbi:MAG: AAA family ATPase [Bifidobacteriaceae bacterium]|jgi:ATP-dependent Clp protease ATP-binding subunit ClpC|nr:AAA family ATPase [Bifidobacteriaceae bacterium]
MAAGIDEVLVLDLARSEVKRWGGTHPSLTHAAWVLSSRWEREFESVFGPGARTALRNMLQERDFRGTQDELSRILRSAADRESALLALRRALKWPDRADTAAPGSTDSKPVDAAPDDSKPDAPAAPDKWPGPTAGAARVVRRVAADGATRGRTREALELAAQLLRAEPVVTALVGDKGVGRTTTLAAVAEVLAGLDQPIPVWSLGPDTIIANPAASLRMVLKDVTSPTVIAVDDLDVLASLSTDHPERDLLDALEEARFHDHARLLVVLNRRYSARLSVVSQKLADTLQTVPIRQLPPEQIAGIVTRTGRQLAARFDLELSGEALEAALTPAVEADGVVQPGLGISRLDLACARAYVEKAKTVGVAHLAAQTGGQSVAGESRDLAQTLRERVKGQDQAIAQVARRLTLTGAQLDLRPERPNGVFLFIGPTGVGKTQLAKELAAAEYGGYDRMIRLDMSEYAHDWAISRIAGPAPGYVGSTEPESWLTTKVVAMPRSLILLDEVEKAHPRVWNLFLQVFDAGRLTDGRGVTADFAETVIVMTSNLGVEEAKSRAIGFGESVGQVDDTRLLAAVKERLAPELLNRVDHIVVFRTLDIEAIEEIARSELAALMARLSSAGWVVALAPEVAPWLARTGHDPAYGARHLQRNIEQELLVLLAAAPTRSLRVDVVDGRLVATPGV